MIMRNIFKITRNKVAVVRYKAFTRHTNFKQCGIAIITVLATCEMHFLANQFCKEMQI